MKKVLALVLTVCMLATLAVIPAALAEDVTGTGTGYGEINVSLTVEDGVITAATIDGSNETPELGGVLVDTLNQTNALVGLSSADEIDGLDAVSSATCVLTVAGIKQAVADALAKVGGAEKTATEQSCDVLVIGGGIAGLTSALSAAENGANVILIDKASALGGTTAIAGGYLICVGSELYAAEAQPFDNMESMVAYWADRMSYSGAESGYPDQERLEGVLAETGSTVDWLAEAGIPWDVNMFIYFGNYPAAHCDGNGAGLVTALQTAVEAKGVTVLTDTKATSLLTDDTGAVTGAVAETSDSVITFNAKSTVLATGGISQNADLVAQYSPKIAAAGVIPTSSGTNTGDGLVMALAVGAGTFEEFGTAINNTCIDPELTAVTADAANIVYAAGLGVDMTGARLGNEASGLNFNTYDQLASDMIQSGNAPFWFILNATDDTAAALQAGVDAGVVKTGDSIAAIAEATGVNAETLAATFADYNTMAAAGEDTQYGKAADYLAALDETALYAVKVYPTTFGSTGGVTTTDQGRVTDAEGNVIAGLYACGEMSNRYYYNENYILAASLGLYATMGHRTGASAAADALAK